MMHFFGPEAASVTLTPKQDEDAPEEMKKDPAPELKTLGASSSAFLSARVSAVGLEQLWCAPKGMDDIGHQI